MIVKKISMRAVYCKCKNKYVKKCSKKCNSPDYWKQGIGSLKNNSTSNLSNINRLRYSEYWENFDTYFTDNASNLSTNYTVEAIDPLATQENFKGGNLYSKFESTQAASQSATIASKLGINYISFWSRYKAGESHEANVAFWFWGRKITWVPSTQLWSNGSKVNITSPVTATITDGEIIDGYQWYKLEFVSSLTPEEQDVLTGTWTLRMFTEAGVLEIFYPVFKAV